MAARPAKNPPPDAPVQLEDRFLRLPEVIQLAGMGKTMIYRKVREGTFPRPYKPGGVSTRWSEDEVRAWKEQVKATRDAA